MLPVNLARVSPFTTALVLFLFPIPVLPCLPPLPPPGTASGTGLAPTGGGATGVLFAPVTINVVVCVVEWGATDFTAVVSTENDKCRRKSLDGGGSSCGVVRGEETHLVANAEDLPSGVQMIAHLWGALFWCLHLCSGKLV